MNVSKNGEALGVRRGHSVHNFLKLLVQRSVFELFRIFKIQNVHITRISEHSLEFILQNKKRAELLKKYYRKNFSKGECVCGSKQETSNPSTYER